MPTHSFQAQQLNHTLQSQNPSIFSLLSEKGTHSFFPKEGIVAQSAQAKGKKYDATIGVALADNGEPLHLSAMQEKISLSPKDIYLYASSYGVPQLRQEWQKRIYAQNPSLKNNPISLPIVANGLTHALQIAGHLFINKDDIIITPDLFWGNYKLIYEHTHHAQLQTFPFFIDNKFNLDGFKNIIQNQKKQKKIILLNFPNNPTGYTPTTEEAKEIVNIITADAQAGNHLLVICDDAYFGFFYEQETFKESLFSLLANAHPNILAIKIDGASKELYAWGLRVAFLTYGSKDISAQTITALEEKTAGALRGSISNSSQLSQMLVLHALQNKKTISDQKNHFTLLQSRYHTIKQTIADPKYSDLFTAIPCNSGYFLCIQPKDKNIDPESLRQLLLQKYDTGVITQNKMIRIAFSSLAEDKISAVIENIASAITELHQN
jgi:aspartate/methionine/tyrosine aminotransferase